jgi:hypothetical protein
MSIKPLRLTDLPLADSSPALPETEQALWFLYDPLRERSLPPNFLRHPLPERLRPLVETELRIGDT